MKGFSLYVNNQEFKIPIQFKQFVKISPQIAETLITYRKYYVESKVSNEVFKSFVDYLVDKKYPRITADNVWEFHLLSKEFGIMSNYLSSVEDDIAVHKLNITRLIKEELKDKSEIERYIARNLDFYLDNFSNDLYKIPINSLYNIFFHEERILKNHEKAYRFITNAPENNDGESSNPKNTIFILLKSLDGSNLSKEALFDSISRRNEHFDYAPFICSSLFNYVGKEIEQQTQKLENYNRQIEEQNEKILNYSKQVEEQDDKIDNLSKRIEDLYEIIINQNRRIEEQEIKIISQGNRIEDQDRKISNQNTSTSTSI